MIKIGKINRFIVENEAVSGFYLKDIDSDSEVYMPKKMAAPDIKVGQDLKAFVYLDSNGTLTATAQLPNAVVGEYALMRAYETTEFGSFFDWGIEKDLLVPGNEQKFKVKEDEDHLVRVCLEEDTNRVYGTTKLGIYIENSEFDIFDGDKVKIVPVQETDLGYRVIINKKFIGMIYHNEIFTQIIIGDTYDALVKKIRLDGLVDVSLQIQGVKNLKDAKVKILSMLEQNGGKAAIHDKSSPLEIKNMLGMSKKTFKSAIGMLYKDKTILIQKDGIELSSKKGQKKNE